MHKNISKFHNLFVLFSQKKNKFNGDNYLAFFSNKKIVKIRIDTLQDKVISADIVNLIGGNSHKKIKYSCSGR